MRSVFLEVCQLLMVVSYWIPGSPHVHAACDIIPMSSRAFHVLIGLPVVTACVVQSSSFSTAFINSSVTLTELLAFWKKIEPYAGPSIEPSYPASISAHAFFSSSTLQVIKSSISG